MTTSAPTHPSLCATSPTEPAQTLKVFLRQIRVPFWPHRRRRRLVLWPPSLLRASSSVVGRAATLRRATGGADQPASYSRGRSSGGWRRSAGSSRPRGCWRRQLVGRQRPASGEPPHRRAGHDGGAGEGVMPAVSDGPGRSPGEAVMSRIYAASADLSALRMPSGRPGEALGRDTLPVTADVVDAAGQR
jgi:hypothetical protein